VSSARLRLLGVLAERIVAIARPHPTRVAIDGVDAAGKTTLADELVAPIAALGRSVIRASVDDFHQPRALRYRAGRHSARGYFRDSFDHAALEAVLLRPLGPGGSRQIRTRVFDYRTDTVVYAPVETAARDAVILLDGIFLNRPELRAHWDLSVFLEVPFEETIARMVERDGALPGGQDPATQRWVGGQRIYLAECSPREHASLVIDNRNVTAPRIVKESSAASAVRGSPTRGARVR
jgi:uridine kinase